LDTATRELLKLAGDTDLEEQITVSAGNNDEVADEEEEGWVDEHKDMTEEDLKELAASLQPV
jgi:hypothetical protein